MDQEPILELAELPQVRRIWYQGQWYYSVNDIIGFLTGTRNPQSYWSTLKNRLVQEQGFEVSSQVLQLKLKATDGRFRLTDTMTRQALLRLIQSIPSPQVEPLRQWLAQVGEERLEEVEHPEAALERVRAAYRAKGYDNAWIEERIKNDLIRNLLTDEWKLRGATDGTQFAVLTSEIHQGTFELTVQAHKKYKVLPTKANLRDHMTPLELALTSVGEAMAITYHQDRDSEGFLALRQDAKDAGVTAGAARKAIEEQSGKQVVSAKNYLKQAKQLPAPQEVEQRPLFEERPNEETPS